jgi:FtsX-like permease family protein
MKALLRAWLGIELRRRGRSLAVLVLLIAIATGTVLTAVAGARRGASAVGRLLAETRPTTVVVLPNQPGFDWNKIRALPEVETLTSFPVSGFEVDRIPFSANPSAFPPADSNVLRGIERPEVLQGRVLDPTRIDEVVVTPKFPTSYHKRLGDWVTLRLMSPAEAEFFDPAQGAAPHGPRIRARIVGVIRSPWFSDHIGDKGQVVASPAVFARYRASFMGARETTYINSLVRLKGGRAAIPAFRKDLAHASGRTDIDVWDQETKFTGPATRMNDFEAVSLLAFGLAALAAAVVLVGQSVARFSAATAGELRTLRAVGMTPRQGIAAASAAPLLAGVVGATLGVAGAVVASTWMPIGAAALLEPHPGAGADWLVLGTGWVLVPALVAAGAAIAAALALRAAGRAGVRRSAVAVTAARAGLPVPVVVGTRFALEPGRGGSAVPVRPAIFGAIAGVLGVLAVFTFSAGVSDAAANPARFGQTYQVESFLGFNGQDFATAIGPVLATAARDPDVVAVNDARVAVADSGNTSIATYTYNPVAKPLTPVLTGGRMPAAQGEIVLAPLTAKAMGAGIGSRVRLTGGRPAPFTVTGIGFVPSGPHNDYSDGGWITPAGFDGLYKGAKFPYKFRNAEVALRPGADTGKVIKRLNAAAAAKDAGGVTFAPPSPIQAVQEIRDVRILPVILAAFLALLAVGAVGHALATAVRRRRHEVAVLRALGMTRSQSRLVVVTQATLLATIGLAFGVPLGIALGRILWRTVADFTPLAYVPPVALWALVLAGPAALLVANLLAAWPGRLAARLRIGHVLRAE